MEWAEWEVLFSAAHVAVSNGRDAVVVAKVAYIPTKNVGIPLRGTPPARQRAVLASAALGIFSQEVIE